MDKRVLVATVMGMLFGVLVFVAFTPQPAAISLKTVNIGDYPFAEINITGKGLVCDVNIITKTESKEYLLPSLYTQKYLIPIDVPRGTSDVKASFKCTPISTIPKTRKECNGGRDYDYFCTGLIENNTYFCGFIQSPRERYHCFAYIERDPRWCIAIKDTYWRSWCITDCVRNGHCDLNACALTRGDFKRVCEGNCEEIKDDLAKEYCKVQQE